MRRELMLSATAMDLQRESGDAVECLRQVVLPISQDRNAALQRSHEYIRLANNLRMYYVGKQENNSERLVRDNEHRLQLFELLERDGILEQVSKTEKTNDAEITD